MLSLEVAEAKMELRGGNWQWSQLVEILYACLGAENGLFGPWPSKCHVEAGMAKLPPRLDCSEVVTTKLVDGNVEGPTMGCLSCV